MKTKHIIIGSRSSRLAIVQARYIMDKLKKFYPTLDIEIKTIKTVGDKGLEPTLSKVGEKGLFTKEIEEALLRQEIDIAVHSMKDLPTGLAGGLKLAAITERENPCDVIVSKQGFSIEELPEGSRVGTSSLRRRTQVLNIRRDLHLLDLRGNLDTRVKKLEEGLYDAIVVAYAGIKRLGIVVNLSVLSTDDILPQAGQGALGIEICKDAHDIDRLVRVLDDPESHLSIDGERALVSALEGGCQVPIGVYAKLNRTEICIKAGIFSLNGKEAVRDEIRGCKKDAEILGRQLAKRIVKNNLSHQILDSFRKGAR